MCLNVVTFRAPSKENIKKGRKIGYKIVQRVSFLDKPDEIHSLFGFGQYNYGKNELDFNKCPIYYAEYPEDNNTYLAGFHVFIDKEQAITTYRMYKYKDYTEIVLKKVIYDNVVAEGIEHIQKIESASVDVALTIEFLEDVQVNSKDITQEPIRS